jgi:polyferredoxin
VSRPEEPAWAGPVLTTALVLGFVLMALQLWLLTVALDLLLGGKTQGFFRLAATSGAVFAGGVLVLALLRKRPRHG